jgi:hypothetical protein
MPKSELFWLILAGFVSGVIYTVIGITPLQIAVIGVINAPVYVLLTNLLCRAARNREEQ